MVLATIVGLISCNVTVIRLVVVVPSGSWLPIYEVSIKYDNEFLVKSRSRLYVSTGTGHVIIEQVLL